ncbi:MAG: ArsA family ATPase [Nannocystaceae bacterium]
MANLLQGRRLLLFTGKGGVGKSTVVASVALAAANQGKRPLIVELGHRASMQGVFGSGPIAHQPTEIVAHPSIHALNLDHQLALEDTIHAQVKVRRLARGIRKNRLLQRLFDAAPAVRELVTLDKIHRLERETTKTGQPRWDPILVDLDATGHAMMFLDLPKVMRQLLAGPLGRVVEDVTHLLTDPAQTALCLVTLPGEIPVEETVELYQHLQTCEVLPSLVFANRVPKQPLATDLKPLVHTLKSSTEPSGLPGLTALEHRLEVYESAQNALATLRTSTQLPVIELPEVLPNREGLQTLGRVAVAQPEPPRVAPRASA